MPSDIHEWCRGWRLVQVAECMWVAPSHQVTSVPPTWAERLYSVAD